MSEHAGVFDEAVTNQHIRDRYELSDDEAQRGAGMDGFNYPVVKIPSAVELVTHGGSAGFDPTNALVVLQDRHHQSFVSCDTSKLPKEVATRINQRAVQLLAENRNDAGKAVRAAIKEYLAIQRPDGSTIGTMNVWVSGGHDPFRRKVPLPPARYELQTTPQQPVKKGSAMHHPSFHTTPPASIPGFPTVPRGMPGTFPANQNPAFAGPVHAPHTAPNGQPLAMPATTAPQQLLQPAQLPEPKEMLIFHLPGINITTKWHKMMLINGSLSTPQGESVIDLLLLVRNELAPLSDNFDPTTPGYGATVGVSFNDGTTRYIHSVMAKYKVGKSQHYVILLHSTTPEPEPVAETGGDPVTNFAGGEAPFPPAPISVPVDLETMLENDLTSELGQN